MSHRMDGPISEAKQKPHYRHTVSLYTFFERLFARQIGDTEEMIAMQELEGTDFEDLLNLPPD